MQEVLLPFIYILLQISFYCSGFEDEMHQDSRIFQHFLIIIIIASSPAFNQLSDPLLHPEKYFLYKLTELEMISSLQLFASDQSE